MALLLVLSGCANGDQLHVATYNVENLFDAEYDGSEFPSFDPRSDHWGAGRYDRSLENTVQVIRTLGGGDGADVLALQEVENQVVLEDLARALVSLGYSHRILVENTGAFHNAVFSRYPVEAVRTHALALPWSGPGRYILEVDINWNGLVLRFLVNHWHSKSGGAEASEPSRREAAAVVARRIRETTAEDGPPVVALGDLNVNADEYDRIGAAYPTALLPARLRGEYDPSRALYLSGKTGGARVGGQGVVVYSPWTAGAMPGSYVYQGQWNSIDHILLGPGF
ncbi:MAG: endonuclease/exonuclease/phosphatase family protein, partial [bacterium]